MAIPTSYDMSTIDIDDILRYAYQNGASDIHLSCGSAPRIRIDGDLLIVPGYPDIGADWLMSQIVKCGGRKIEENFENDREADFRHDIEDLSGFRVNAHYERGEPSAVFRIIPTEIKTLVELGAPAILEDLTKRPKGLILITGPTGSGKALSLATRIPTPTGWTTMGELKKGDEVLDSKFNTTRVTGLSEINENPDLYRVVLSDGQTILADSDHQWIVASHDSRNKEMHHKYIKTLNNSKRGLEAAERLQGLSNLELNKEVTILDIFEALKENSLESYFPSKGSVIASLRFMDVELKGGNGPIPLTASMNDSLKALSGRLIQRYEREDHEILRVMSTSEMIEEGLKNRDRNNFSIPLLEETGSKDIDLAIRPYLLGAWLGDGNTGDGRISSGHGDSKEMLKILSEYWNSDHFKIYKGERGIGITLGKNPNLCKRGHGDYTPCVKCKECQKDYSAHMINRSFGELLSEYSLRNNKHIPKEYLRASFSQRLELLQGLMDTDGHVAKGGNGMALGFSHYRLAHDSLELVRSLGIKATIRKKKAGYKNPDGSYVPCKDTYSIDFLTELPVCKLPRKLERIKKTVRKTQKWLYITDIQSVSKNDPEYGPVRCISVDSPDSSYLCADFVVTHNSTTLAGMINAINETRPDHIMTIEDPIEFVHRNKRALIRQREVGSDTKSFAEALKRVLRQDPDVILVGELRDPETIATALTAAETGHLVFGTLHTQSASKTIDRIIDSFPSEQQGQIRSQLSDTLQAVISQMLVKKKGGGRIAVNEIMINNNAIANNIREGNIGMIYSAIQTGKTDGMHTLDQDIQRLVRKDLIEKDEVMALLTDKHALDGISITTNDWSQ